MRRIIRSLIGPCLLSLAYIGTLFWASFLVADQEEGQAMRMGQERTRLRCAGLWCHGLHNVARGTINLLGGDFKPSRWFAVPFV